MIEYPLVIEKCWLPRLSFNFAKQAAGTYPALQQSENIKITTMKYLLVTAFLFISAPLFAQDTIVIQFTISETSAESPERTSYTNAVLMGLNEEVNLDLDERYVLKIRVNEKANFNANIVMTLKDVIEGKPYYVGAKSIDVAIGDQSSFEIEKYETLYSVSIDTSFGELPKTN